MRKQKYVGSYPVIVVVVVSIEIEAGYKRRVMQKNTKYDYFTQEAHWARVLQNIFMIFAAKKTN